MKAITRRQREYLDYIKKFTLTQGYPPTIADIARHFDVNVNSVTCVLNSLRKKKFITNVRGRSRTITVLENF